MTPGFRDSARWLMVVAGSLAVMGCGNPSSPSAANLTPTFPGVTIAVAAVGDPAILATIAPLRGDWTSSRQAELTVRETPVEPNNTQGADVLIFRGDRLGDLVAAKALATIPESALRPPAQEADAGREARGEAESATPPDPLQFSSVSGVFRDQVTKYGRERVGLPYGGSALVLVYHRDAFEKEANRQAALQAKVELKPPATWPQLDALAHFFQGRDWNGDGSPDHGISLALGPDPEGVGDATYLARAASLGKHRANYSFLFDSSTMEPRIDSPPFVEALEGLAALRACGPPGIEKFDAEQAREAFRRGNVALLIDRAERVASWSDGKSNVGVAPLPGSERVYESKDKGWQKTDPPNAPAYLPFGGGWLVAVARGSSPERQKAAVDFVKYLVEPETSNRVRADTSFPMLPVRGAQVSQGPADPRAVRGVDGKQWADAVQQTYLSLQGVPGLRIPEAGAYLTDLGRARQAVVEGKQPASAALQDAAKAWSERNRKLGVEYQLWHYRRSLDPILVTSPEPPPRG